MFHIDVEKLDEIFEMRMQYTMTEYEIEHRFTQTQSPQIAILNV